MTAYVLGRPTPEGWVYWLGTVDETGRPEVNPDRADAMKFRTAYCARCRAADHAALRNSDTWRPLPLIDGNRTKPKDRT